MWHDLDPATTSKMYQAHIRDGVPPEMRKVPHRNIRDVLSMHAKASPRKTFLISYDRDDSRQVYTYAEFNALVHQAANLMYEDLGIRRGDRVATIAYNHADTVLIYFACWVIGATVAPQNVSEDDRRIAFILRHSEAKVCFVFAEYLDRAKRIISGADGADGEEGAPGIETIVRVGGSTDENHLSFHDALTNRPTTFLGDESGAKSTDLPIAEAGDQTPTLDDEALLVYTSGTTGTPKGVILTQYNLLVDAFGVAEWHAITGNQRMMCVLPIHHVNGILVTIITPMYVGGSTVLNRRFSVSHFWERIARDRVQVVSVVPTLLQFLLEYGETEYLAGRTVFGGSISRRGLNSFSSLHLWGRDSVCIVGA